MGRASLARRGVGAGVLSILRFISVGDEQPAIPLLPLPAPRIVLAEARPAASAVIVEVGDWVEPTTLLAEAARATVNHQTGHVQVQWAGSEGRGSTHVQMTPLDATHQTLYLR